VNLHQFKEGMDFVKKWEGGFVDDPDDPGGRTNYGISQRAYPQLDIKNLTYAQAAEIYFKDYWSKAGCSSMEYPLNIAVFDSAINCGVSRAIHWLKKSTNVMEYLELRKQHYLELAKKDSNKKFLKGWLNRLGDLKKLVEIGIAKEALV
jgi:lysozyme family protein